VPLGRRLESVRVGRAADLEPPPRPLLDGDARAGDLVAARQEVLGEPGRELLARPERTFGGEAVDGVAHRVGGEDLGVVAGDVRHRELAGEPQRDGEVAQRVAAAGAALDLDQPHALLAVVVVGERDVHQVPR
jgi:hypothetical protein